MPSCLQPSCSCWTTCCQSEGRGNKGRQAVGTDWGRGSRREGRTMTVVGRQVPRYSQGKGFASQVPAGVYAVHVKLALPSRATLPHVPLTTSLFQAPSRPRSPPVDRLCKASFPLPFPQDPTLPSGCLLAAPVFCCSARSFLEPLLTLPPWPSPLPPTHMCLPPQQPPSGCFLVDPRC